MKKDKLVHGKLFLNVVDSLLHYVACTKIAKDIWGNFCATFEKDMLIIDCNHIKNFTILKCRKYPCASSY
jgi:hypothetical protein